MDEQPMNEASIPYEAVERRPRQDNRSYIRALLSKVPAPGVAKDLWKRIQDRVLDEDCAGIRRLLHQVPIIQPSSKVWECIESELDAESDYARLPFE